MQVDYLFLIPLMPAVKLDVQRAALRSLCFSQLKRLKSSHRVWLLGNADDEISDFELIKLQGTSKEDKLWEAGKILKAGLMPAARYIVRLDDDDLISPELFDEIAKSDFDCYTDRYHQFYDLSSGKVSAQKRDWFPNTAIHKFEHALTQVPRLGGSEHAGESNFLFACDHSKAWHPFYENKNVKFTGKDNPLYLRVLNPGSVTAIDNQMTNYIDYLAGFGNWKASFPLKNIKLKEQLEEIWVNDNGHLMTYKFPKKTMLKRVVERIKK